MSDLCQVPGCATLQPGDFVDRSRDALVCRHHFLLGLAARELADAPAETAPQVGPSQTTRYTPDGGLATAPMAGAIDAIRRSRAVEAEVLQFEGLVP